MQSSQCCTSNLNLRVTSGFSSHIPHIEYAPQQGQRKERWNDVTEVWGVGCGVVDARRVRVRLGELGSQVHSQIYGDRYAKQRHGHERAIDDGDTPDLYARQSGCGKVGGYKIGKKNSNEVHSTATTRHLGLDDQFYEFRFTHP